MMDILGGGGGGGEESESLPAVLEQPKQCVQ